MKSVKALNQFASGHSSHLLKKVPRIRLLESIVDSLPTGLVVVDRDLRYVFVNEQAAALNGHSVEEHIGQRICDLVPDVFRNVEPFYLEVFRTGRPVRAPAFQATTSAFLGMKRWWEAQYSPLFDDDGNLLGVRGMFTDATERIMAESTLSSTLQEMRSIFDALPVGLAIARDKECRDVEVNNEYRRLLSLPPQTTFEQWFNESREFTFRLDGEEIARDELPLRRAARSGHLTETGKVDVLAPDGSQISLMVRAVPLTREGVVYGAVASYVEITELVRIQQELRDANLAQSDFLAMVSHELRTPMTMILGNAQLLSRGEEAFSAEVRLRLANDIYSESVSLSCIVDNLLLMTRLDRHERLEAEPLVLRHLCEKILRHLPPGEAARCNLSASAELPLVMANPTSIEQVMRNLISNALKYSPPGEQVTMTIDLNGDEVVFSVGDRGPGITPPDRSRVFEPFFRAESTSTRSGMGIGLAISKRLVQAMKGRIWTEAREGGGSVFSFALKALDEA